MGLNNLPNTILLQIFSALTQEQRQVVESDPMMGSTLSVMDESREKLSQACISDDKEQVLKRLGHGIKVADQSHDAELSLLWSLLNTKLLSLRVKGLGAQALFTSVEGIIETLFPDGMSQVTKSYLQEASEAPVHFSNLSPAQHTTLQSISFDGDTALAITHRWLVAAERLGDLIRKRSIVEGSSTKGNANGDKSRARPTAIGRLRLFLDMLPHSQLELIKQEALSTPIMAAVAEYDKRQKRRAAADDTGMEEPESETVVECEAAPDDWAGVIPLDEGRPPLELSAA